MDAGAVDVARLWQGHGRPGHFPDLDMLPLGRISLRSPCGRAREAGYTADERRTMLTLWAMFQSPLMLGGELSTLSPELVELLTNPEVLEVDQRGRGDTLPLFFDMNRVHFFETAEVGRKLAHNQRLSPLGAPA